MACDKDWAKLTDAQRERAWKSVERLQRLTILMVGTAFLLLVHLLAKDVDVTGVPGFLITAGTGCSMGLATLYLAAWNGHQYRHIILDVHRELQEQGRGHEA